MGPLVFEETLDRAVHQRGPRQALATARGRVAPEPPGL